MKTFKDCMAGANKRLYVCDCRNADWDFIYGLGKRQHRPLWDPENNCVLWLCESCMRLRPKDKRATQE
jgi:hypothetical protein